MRQKPFGSMALLGPAGELTAPPDPLDGLKGWGSLRRGGEEAEWRKGERRKRDRREKEGRREGEGGFLPRLK